MAASEGAKFWLGVFSEGPVTYAFSHHRCLTRWFKDRSVTRLHSSNLEFDSRDKDGTRSTQVWVVLYPAAVAYV